MFKTKILGLNFEFARYILYNRIYSHFCHDDTQIYIHKNGDTLALKQLMDFWKVTKQQTMNLCKLLYLNVCIFNVFFFHLDQIVKSLAVF